MLHTKFKCIFLTFILIGLGYVKSLEWDNNELNPNEVIALNASNDIGSAKQNENVDQLTPKDQLLYFTLIAFRDISQNYVDRAANISQDIIKDEDLKRNDSPIIKEFRKNITDFLQQYEKYEELDELFNLVDLYSNTTSQYFEMDTAKATVDMLSIESKLKKYGSDDLDREFEKQFLLFVDRFYAEMQGYKEKLSQDEMKKEAAPMFEWLEEFKPIQNIEEKILSFEKFFRFYED
ncbi:uncharacterized protein [Musca autumnalis]|uniref:uncharacterized protein n=1 Tax=Musca autumnalis TaxID=221902 RepID=UPI003CF99675